MNRYKSIFGGVAWSIISNLIGAIYSFVSVPILLTYFGKQQYGLIGIALSVNVYLRILDMGFSSGNVKFFSTFLVKKDNEGLNMLFQSSILFYLSIAFINALILFILSYFCQSVFHLTSQETGIFKQLLYILIITSFPIWVSNVMEQLLRSNDLVSWQQRVSMLSKIGQLVTLFLTIFFKLSLVSFFALNTSCTVLIIPIYILKIRDLSLGISFFPRYYQTVMSEVLPYCLSVFSFGLFQFSANYLRPVLIGMKLGLTSVADFRLIEGIANLILILGSSFLGVILPHATKAKATNDREAEKQIASNGTRYISIFLSIIIFGFILSSKDLITLYVGAENAYLALWFNIWALSLLGLHSAALSSIVLSGNDLRPIVYMSAFSTILSLALAWILMDYFGMGGVIISYTAYVILQMTYYYVYYYPKKLGFSSKNIFIHSFFIPVIIIGCISVSINLVSRVVIITEIYTSILFKELIFISFAIISTYFILLTSNEKQYINRSLNKFINALNLK